MTGYHATWKRLGALSGIAVAVASFLGWQAGYTVVDPGPPLARTRWSLPGQVAEDPARDLAILTARRPWSDGFAGQAETGPDGQRGAAAGSAQALQWRLAGVVERPDGNFVLIATGPPNAVKFEYRAVGDTLPDGSTLVEITSESATIQGAGKDAERRALWLFRAPASAEGPASKPGLQIPPKANGAALVAPDPRIQSASASARSQPGRAHPTTSLRQSVSR
jgi:hypothetical protein